MDELECVDLIFRFPFLPLPQRELFFLASCFAKNMMLVAKNVSHDHVNGTGQLHSRTCILGRPKLVAKQDSSWDSELERELGPQHCSIGESRLPHKSHMNMLIIYL